MVIAFSDSTPKIPQRFLERQKVVGAVAGMEDGEGDDAEVPRPFQDLVSVDPCDPVSRVLECAAPKSAEHDMPYAMVFERVELG